MIVTGHQIVLKSRHRQRSPHRVHESRRCRAHHPISKHVSSVSDALLEGNDDWPSLIRSLRRPPCGLRCSTIQPASQARLTIAVMMEVLDIVKTLQEYGIDMQPRGEANDETAGCRFESGPRDQGEDPGASAVRSGPDSRPPRNQALYPDDSAVRR